MSTTTREDQLAAALNELLLRCTSLMTEEQLDAVPYAHGLNRVTLRNRLAELREIAGPPKPIGRCDDCGEPTYVDSIRPWACSSRCYSYIMGIDEEHG